jgi:hypothetical protein
VEEKLHVIWNGGNALDLNSGDVLLESWQGYRQYWETFSWFPSVPPSNCRDNTSIRSLPLPSKSFTVHQSLYHSELYSPDTKTVAKKITTSALDGGECSASCSGRLPPEKPALPTVQNTGWKLEPVRTRCWRDRYLPPLRVEPPILRSPSL